MNAVKDEFHEDFAETIEEIRKSQEMLDQLCSDMVKNPWNTLCNPELTF